VKLPKKPRIILAGSVNSSLLTLKKLLEHNCNLVGVLALSPDRSKNVSGFQDLKPFAEKYNVPSVHFDKINEAAVYQFVEQKQPDLLFVIGLSQMVREPLLGLAKFGNVGFHPTRLPEGRGRGAVAWMILGKAKGAATFFLLDEGMDSGPILGQKDFEVEEHDYASDIIEKIKLAISEVLDYILPEMNKGLLELKPQDHSRATYLGRRKPKDGLINWDQPWDEVYRLIRATAPPLPGAYSYWKEGQLLIYRATPADPKKYIGVPGRIIAIEEKRILVACREGAIWLEDFSAASSDNFRVGADLG